MSRHHDRFGLVGQTVAQKYLVEAAVAEGGFSVVYRARHVLWNRAVALKAFAVPEHLSEDAKIRLEEGLVREGALLAELSERSPAIVQSRDVGAFRLDSGEWVPFLVLEWLDGTSLDHVLDAERAQGKAPRTIGAAMELLAPIAGALATAHARGVSHRDVKPGNVVLLRDGGVKLLDFGVAEARRFPEGDSDGGRRGARSFTAAYGAPEQFGRGLGPTGPWTDVFALALLLVELLTGKPALEGRTPEELARSSSRRRVRPTPRTRGAEVPDAVEAVLARALAVEPGERFDGVGAMWAALEAAAPAPRAIEARRRSTFSAISAPIVRRRARWSERLAAFIAGASVAGAATFVAISPWARRVAVADEPSSSPPRPPTPAPAAPLAPKGCPARMALVPEGTFFQGDDEGAPEERPARAVHLDAFCIDVTEVTTADYEACVASGACAPSPASEEGPRFDAIAPALAARLCTRADAEANADHAVNCVDWSAAAAYCAHRGARLPREAEWERAARGSDGRLFPWGDAPPSARLVNACGGECAGPKRLVASIPLFRDDDGFSGTAPVARYPEGASPWGVHDLAGNVAEWTADTLGRDDERVVRGGAFSSAAEPLLRATARRSLAKEARSVSVGFRCAVAP